MPKHPIVISKGGVTITLPPPMTVEVGGEEVSTSTTMASGKIVKDVTGVRVSVKASWDYVPAELLVSLCSLLRQGGFFNVQYPDPTGRVLSSVFEISQPSFSLFAYIRGVAVWHDVSLDMTAQEVLQDAGS